MSDTITAAKDYTMIEKRLKKSKDRKLWGVCGGIAEYFDMDPALVRVLFVLFVLCAGTGILAYFIAAIIMEDKSED